MCYGIRRMKVWSLAVLLVVLVAASGCSTVRSMLGITGPGEPTINLKSAETRWVLTAMAALTLALGIVPSPLFDLCGRAISASM